MWQRFVILQGVLLLVVSLADGADGLLHVEVQDERTRETLPARIYVQGEGGRYFLAEAERGVVTYRIRRGSSQEQHSCVLGKARFRLPAGEYTITVVRGKEYIPVSRRVRVAPGRTHRLEVRVQRWAHMAASGWLSADTHVHRSPAELAVVQCAEDLNVTFPLSYWVHDSNEAPLEPRLAPHGDQVLLRFHSHASACGPYLCYTQNTEYEITSIAGRRHVLGAFFVLAHRRPFHHTVPPVSAVFREAHAQGALIDLDKHNWPWSPALAALGADLYELANNHMWRTTFHFRRFGLRPPAHWQIETDDTGGLTERGWIEFTHRMYWALLNVGLRLKPTAGTASGVHPVPLGFGRVYAKVGQRKDLEGFLEALRAGRSFVTTGPLMEVTVGGQEPGSSVELEGPADVPVGVRIAALNPIRSVEVIQNGKVVAAKAEANTEQGAVHRVEAVVRVHVAAGGWIAVRAFTDLGGGRIRFAHSGPVYVTVQGRRAEPDARDVDYLIAVVREELARSGELLSPDAIAEYRKALRYYQSWAPGP